jgi:hypothetical protein
MCLQVWTDFGVSVSRRTSSGTGRTGIFLIFRIGGLKKDLDTVERRNDRLCLGKVWIARSSVGPVWAGKKWCYTRHIQQHRQRCQSESLGPQFLSWNHQSSFEFNAHTQVGRRCGGSLRLGICSDAPVRIVRHVIQAYPFPTLHDHGIQSEIRRQSSQRTGWCASLLGTINQ